MENSSYQMGRQFVEHLFLCAVVLVLYTFIPQGVGGSLNGDPAPGRSPGPPPISHGNLVAVGSGKTVKDDPMESRNGSDLICRENIASKAEEPYINMTFYHPLFEIAALTPGISYYVFVDTFGGNIPIGEIFISATSNGLPTGSWKNKTVRVLCPNDYWVVKNVEESSPLVWTFFHAHLKAVNVTFRMRYKLKPGLIVEEEASYAIITDCVLKLRGSDASFGSGDLPSAETCKIKFPRRKTSVTGNQGEGLLIELTRLNVPCVSGAYIQFVSEEEEETNALNEEIRIEAKKLCGKLEELAPGERKLYFPFQSNLNFPLLIVYKNPTFKLNYTLVDYCYNITFVAQNGSEILNPVKNLLCHFRIHLPYGNRVLLRLQLGEDRFESATTKTETNTISERLKSNQTMLKHPNGSRELDQAEEEACDGLLVAVWNGELTWMHCSKSGDPKRDVQVWSQENIIDIKIVAQFDSAEEESYPTVKFWYHAEPIADIVGPCNFGEVFVKQFCVSAVYVRMEWDRAEQFCVKHGGHLASIREESAQVIIDNYLINRERVSCSHPTVVLHASFGEFIFLAITPGPDGYKNKSPNYRDQNSFWIGASDKIYEGHFKWSDGSVFSYANWFLGWSGFSNRQPNDDGFSHQDCVEIRRTFPHPASSRIINSVTSSFLWNDLDCGTKNFFICERFQNGQSFEQGWTQECNKTIALSREHPKSTVVSPGFPHRYPDNIRCEIFVLTVPGYRIILDFEELVIENESSCSYDYLEIAETSWNETVRTRKLCGDMSDKLKLLRYVSRGPSIKLVFVSDYSRHYGGFKARASIENAGMECADEKHHNYNGSCYLFVSYPKVTWQTARQICTGMKADLASVQTAGEESFITRNIRSSIEYSTSSIYWLGGHVDSSDTWIWTDNTPMEYSAWLTGSKLDNSIKGNLRHSCLAVRWMSVRSETEPPTSGLYWTPELCKKTGGYVCKKRNPVSNGNSLNLNRTINGTEGRITSSGYPGPYHPNLDYYTHLVGPIWTRMVINFNKLDLESQTECLYDFIELSSGGAKKAEVRWCGSKSPKSDREIFVSDNNEILLRFHSDYSVSGSGFSATWRAIDVTSCPSQKLTAREGIIMSPNYGEFLLPRLDCKTTILAPPGKRIWLEFTDSSVSSDAKRNQKDVVLEIELGSNAKTINPFRNEKSIGDGNFISLAEKMSIRLKTGEHPRGRGFRAIYRTVGSVHEERILELAEETEGFLYHLNYPRDPPSFIDFIQHLVAPMGYIISVDFHQVTFSELGGSCPDGLGIIEVNDNYDEVNKTWRFLCQVDNYSDNFLMETPPVSITSFFNSLHIRQRSFLIGVRMNATLKVLPDPNFRLKLMRTPKDGTVESCHPNPCQNGGKCRKKKCECLGHFTGIFCVLTYCDLQPCEHGQCELTDAGFRCRCHSGYIGQSCETKQRPCALNPCEGRGDCIDNEKSSTFHCRCHAWWEGQRCERKMMHIPFKPLSERMLQEPFWLGLITVFLVLGVIGIVWCAKRHFPEKLEKLLAEEADKHGRSNVSGGIRPLPIREQVMASSGAVSVPSPQGTANCPRTLFGRLGIRKSSLLSLTSPQHQDGANSRTFSLDDLLRPTPRRTPSPRKKHTNSTHTKKNPSEKKQILQQLISPSSNPSPSAKVHFDELLLMNESIGGKPPEKGDASEWKETSFTKQDQRSDVCKLEKKVTFARLLNKVSAEMSSGSEVENAGSFSMKAVSTPVSPAADRKSARSMNSNQGSDSLSGSEIDIAGSTANSLLDIPCNGKRPSKLPTNKGGRNSSADSILAMFRNFTSTTNMSKMSPNSSPTISSPQDEKEISDDSSAVETPVSTSSGQTDSPARQKTFATTIDIPVMDALTAQKSVFVTSNLLQPPSILLEIPSGGLSKCLSPIHEVPTPISSPALTPILPRNSVKISADTSDEDVRSGNEGDDSEYSSEMLIEIHQEDNGLLDTPTHSDVKLLSPMQSSEKSGLQMLNISQVHGPKEETLSSKLVIPILTVQEPSPTSTSPPFSFLGSPPPQRAMDTASESSSRKPFKELDKPNSLDLPYPPPLITITCNSGVDSDTESISPAGKGSTLGSHNQSLTNSGMTFLSPFSMGSRADRTASESNLSSSGYSSMASPGPSRCNSNNPLCFSEIEDQQQSHSQPPSRRPSPLLRTPLMNNHRDNEPDHRRRSDSETLSDDPLMESNDEGIGTDHLEEKIEDGDLKSARDLETFIAKDQNFLNFGALVVPGLQQRCSSKKCDNLEGIVPSVLKASLQLPTIVVQSDCCDKLLSPVSSRSESPLSDKTLGLGRFSPMFYSKGKSDPLPFTDSDGLYDFPSSDCIPSNNKGVQAGIVAHRKSTGRRRERRPSHRGNSKVSSPTALPTTQLELSIKDGSGHRFANQRKPSPKRRVRNQQPLSSSSSTESLHSAVEKQGKDSDEWSLDKTGSRRNFASNETSGEDTGEDTQRQASKCAAEIQKGHKISGFRTIGHQIRFLRRLEFSLRRKERLASLLDSAGEEDDPDDVSSSLLPRNLRKSGSINILQQHSTPKRQRNMKKRSSDHLPQEYSKHE